MSRVLISDPTLRDGNHAIRHQLTQEQIAGYCRKASAARIPIVEVGHGNGLGASSLQLGESRISDKVALETAKQNLTNGSLLGIHVIPGFATIKKDLQFAIDLGVDVVRVASHCSEADLTENHLSYARQRNKTAYGVLMMSHMLDPDQLAEQALKMEGFGAQGVIIMDSSGHYLTRDVTERILALKSRLSVPVGFHAHNNLGLAIANSVAAVEAGATILDGCARGFGAGAGNAQLEVLVAVLQRMKIDTGIDLYGALDAGDYAEQELIEALPTISSVSIVSGLAGVFSGFMKPVQRIALQFSVDPRDIFFELGRRKIIAGQEDIIIEVADQISKKNKESSQLSAAPIRTIQSI